jgi:hypothetical protein
MRLRGVRRIAAIVVAAGSAVAALASQPPSDYYDTAAWARRPLEIGLFRDEPKVFEVRFRTTPSTYGERDRLTAALTVTASVTEVVPPEEDSTAPAPVRLVLEPIDAEVDDRYPSDCRWQPLEGAPPQACAAALTTCCETRFRLELRAVERDFVRVNLDFFGELAGFVAAEEDDPTPVGDEGRLFIDLIEQFP